MKTLTYIFCICLLVLAGCGGHSANEMYISEESISTDSTQIVRNISDGDSRFYFDSTTTGISPIPRVESPGGTLVYKLDSVLTIGVVSRVEARIIKKIGQSTTDQLVQMTTHTTTGVIRTKTIKVGDIMDMDLVALQKDKFEINKIISGDQPVDETTVTEWLWGVTALETGDYNLILKAKIKDNGASREEIVFDKQINVVNKPKRFYNMKTDIPMYMLEYVDNTIKIELFERRGDTYFVEWGGNGKVVLEIVGLNPGEIVNVTKDEDIDYTINDNKSLFNYTWVIKPEKLNIERDSLHYIIKIIGDYEEVIITDRLIKMDKNWKGWFNGFIDDTAKRWYWVLSTLLIPVYLWIKNKFFRIKK